MDEDLEIVSEIYDIEIIAVGRRIRDIRRLKRSYGDGRWRKLKGRATVITGRNRQHGRNSLV
jgi:hypothetical protein